MSYTLIKPDSWLVLALWVLLTHLASNSSLTAAESSPSKDQSPQLQAAALKQEAIDIAKRMVAAYPEEALAYALLGSAYYNAGRSEEATKHLKRCLELNPNQVEAYEVLARAAYEKGSPEECIRISREALTHGSPNPELLNRLARAQIDIGSPQDAVTTLTQATSLPRSIGESWYLLGQAHLQSGDYSKAKEAFQKAIERVPDHTQAFFGLFTSSQRLGQAEDANRFRQQFLKLEESDRRSHTDRSSNEDTLTGLPSIRESVARTLMGAAQVQRAHGQLPGMLELLRRACILDPENGGYRANLESLFLQSSSINSGLKTFQEMTEEQPKSAMNHLFVGRFQARVQDIEGAERSYRKVQELAPDRMEGYRALADLYFRGNRELVEATKLARKCIELEPSGSNYHLLALICIKTGDRPAALESARQAVTQSPGDPKYAQLLKQLEQSQ